MSGYYNGRQPQDAAAAPASAPRLVVDRGTANIIQRKPVAGASSTVAPASPSAVPQHSLSVSSAGHEGYTVSPASSIHRDRESHTAEAQYQEVSSPVSLGQQSHGSPEIPSGSTAAPVTSYPQQWQQPQRASRTGMGYTHGSPPLEALAGTVAESGAGIPLREPQPTLLPPLQPQSSIQWPEPDDAREVPSWIHLRRPTITNELYPAIGAGDTHAPLTQRQRQRLSDVQQELAEARAREILMGGPRVVSYGPAPPVEDRGVAPTEFSMPSLYPGKRDAPSPAQAYDATATISSPGMGWQLQSVVNPPVADLNKTLPQQPFQTYQPEIRTVHVDEVLTNEKTRFNTALATQEKKRSPFMHYEDIDYFGPEPDDTDLDSPDLETEQEKLKFAEAQFYRLGGDDQPSSGKAKQTRAVVTEVGSAVTPTPAPLAVVGGSRVVEGSTYFSQPIPGSTSADGLQMGVKARRSWGRQQRRQAKAKKQQHQHLDHNQPTSHVPATGTNRPHAIDMIMRIPSLISSAGRGGGGSSVFGGGSNDNNSRSGDGGTVDAGDGNGFLRPGEGGVANNNPYYIARHDGYLNEPPRTDGMRSSHHSSHRSRRSNGLDGGADLPNTSRGTHIHKPQSTPQSSNNQSLISDWLPEIIYLLVSMAVLVATFLTLRAFDGQSIDPSHWPISPSITLNTLIAFLTAICQLSLLIPITQGLAQLKWNWFARAAPAGTPVPGRERSLGDFGLFDDAAFGTGRYGGWSWGATRLLFSGKGRTLGVGACLVLLTGWLSGPFTQGTVGYRMGEVPVEGDAIVKRAERYFLTSSSSDRGNIVKRKSSSNQYQDPGVSQRRAIQQGIHYHPYSYSTATTNTNDTSRPAIPLLPPLPPHCSTPSCQFPLFSSLAICVDTIDLSSQLTISNLSTASGRTPLATAFDFLEFMPDSSTTLDSIRNATLPNGAYLVGSRDTCNLNITSSSSLPRGRASGGDRRPVDTLDALFPLPTDTTTLGFNNQPDKLSAAIANFFIIYTNQTTSSTPNSSEETTFAAAEVLFHFCVNTYNVSVTQGVPTSEIVNSTTELEEVTTTTSDGTEVLHLRDPLSSVHNKTAAGGPFSFSLNLTATQILQTQLVSLIGGTYSSSSSYPSLMKGLTPTSEVLGSAMFEYDPNFDGSLSTTSTGNEAEDGNDSGGVKQLQLQHRQTIGNFMQNVATSLTNALRASSSSAASTNQTSRIIKKRAEKEAQTAEAANGLGPVITGTSYLPTALIVISYAPMAFLSIQVFLSAAFLVGIIIQTAVWGVPVLKGSADHTLRAISSGDRAVLEEEEEEEQQQRMAAAEGKEMGGKVKRRHGTGAVKLRLVRGGLPRTPGNGEGRRAGGWYLDTSCHTLGGGNHDNSLP